MVTGRWLKRANQSQSFEESTSALVRLKMMMVTTMMMVTIGQVPDPRWVCRADALQVVQGRTRGDLYFCIFC